MAGGPDVVLEEDVYNHEPGHAAKHNAVNEQVNYLTPKVEALRGLVNAGRLSAGGLATLQDMAIRSARAPMRSDPLFGATPFGRGGNIVPTPTQTAVGSIAWALLHKGIAVNDGVSREWVAAQIAAAHSIGLDRVRIIGTIGGITGGILTRAQAHAAAGWVIEYARSLGMTVYWAMSGWTDYDPTFGPAATGILDATYPTSAHVAEIVALAVFLRDTANVVRIDIVQEYVDTGLGTEAELATHVIDLVNAIRAAGVETPLTCSRALNGDLAHPAVNQWPTSFHGTQLVFSAIDVHLYYAGTGGVVSSPPPLPAPTHPTQSYAALPDGMPLVIGEVGISKSYTDADRLLYYQAVATLLPGSRIIEVYPWAIADQSTADLDKYGMFAGAPGGALTARNVATEVSTWPTSRSQPMLKKHKSAPQTITPDASQTITPGDVTEYDHGGLGNGGGGQWFIIPPGLGGSYEITVCLGVSAGGAAGGFDCLLRTENNESESSEVLTEVWGSFAAGEDKQFQSPRCAIRLADGTQGFLRIYSEESIDLTAGPHRTFVALRRLSD